MMAFWLRSRKNWPELAARDSGEQTGRLFRTPASLEHFWGAGAVLLIGTGPWEELDKKKSPKRAIIVLTTALGRKIDRTRNFVEG